MMGSVARFQVNMSGMFHNLSVCLSHSLSISVWNGLKSKEIGIIVGVDGRHASKYPCCVPPKLLGVFVFLCCLVMLYIIYVFANFAIFSKKK